MTAAVGAATFAQKTAMKKSVFTLFCCLMLAGSSSAQWNPQAIGQFPLYDWTDQIRIADENHVWAGITNAFVYDNPTGVLPRLARTVDGGETWSVTTIPGTEGYLGWGLSALGADTAFFSLNLRNSPNDRLYRTTDGGASWSLVVQDTAAGYLVHFFDAQNGVLYRGPYNTKFTTDGGLTWQTPANVPAGLADQGIFWYPGSETEIEGNSILAGLESGVFFRSDDRGHTWQDLPTPLTVPISEIAFENGDTGLIVSMFGVYNATNDSWTTGGLPSRLLHTADGGQSWTEIPAAQLPFAGQALFVSALEATGQPGQYVMEAGVSGSLNYTTFRSDDGGQSWTEVSGCPNESIGVMAFQSPEVGFAGSALLQSITHGLFFKWGETPATKAVFTVSLGAIPPSAEGVHLATDLYGWDPAAVPMTHAGGNVWTAEVPASPGATLLYRFVNGLTLNEAETVPAGCGQIENGAIVRAAYMPNCGNLNVVPVTYGGCLPAGELAPQTLTDCDTSGYLICENFDGYGGGKMGAHSALWTAYGCNFDGTEGDACDVDLNGFHTGFTNFSGQWALHPNGKNGEGEGHAQSVELNLGDPPAGRYELALKLYVPEGRGAFLVIYLDADYGSVDLNVTPGGELTYNRYNSSDFTYTTEATANLPLNQWVDLRLVFDLQQHRRECRIDGALLHETDDADLQQVLTAGFFGNGVNPEDYRLEYFIDDLTWRDLNAVPVQEPGKAPAIYLTVSPNPAGETATTHYRLSGNREGRLRLVDGLGRVLRDVELPGGDGKITLSLGDLPAGLYRVRVSDEAAVAEGVLVKR